MKTPIAFRVVPAALAMSLVLTNAQAETPHIEINSKMNQDPLIVNGQSGGGVKSDCGYITKAPNQVIQVTEPIHYLRLTVESKGQPTLLIDGPGGRFCVLADSYSEGKAELSGYWQPGKYLLHIGESSQSKYNYTLSISQQKKPAK